MHPLVSEVLASVDVLAPTRVVSDDYFGFTIDSHEFQRLLEKFKNIVPTRDTKPVLKNIKITVAESFIQLYATNLEFSLIVSSTAVSALTPGESMLPYKRLLDVVTGAGAGPLDVVIGGGKVLVEAGRTNWDLALQLGMEYPPFPNITGLVLHEIDSSLFVKGLQSVKYAAARDSSRSSSSLMMVNIDNNGKMTACDGSRFQQFNLGSEFPLPMNIPVGAIDTVLSMISLSDSATLGVGAALHHLVFDTRKGVLIINKLAAKFPDMESALLRPSLTNDRELKVDRRALITAIRRVRINADPDTAALGLYLSVNSLSVYAKDRFNNDAQESLDVSWLGGNYDLMVNHSHFLEMLQMCSSDVCRFRLGSDAQKKKSPVLLEQEDGAIGVIPQMNPDWVGALQR